MYGEPDGLSDPSCPCDLSHRLAWETVVYIVVICNLNVERNQNVENLENMLKDTKSWK